ncbi:helix-turn-helix domain-containing protein [Mucilaginibacter sp.]|uniref:helix-turn-helix domain-containing protein n=1 Tax=Mucilaginibacter sp. TaxID=1882438 RepID=UPI003AFF827B
MEKPETIEEFYKAKLNKVPDNLKKEIGHFNVFKLDDFVGPRPKPTPYSRKDFFKISLIFGKNKVYYADKVIEIKKQALFFANPQIPYTWEAAGEEQSGFFCVFTPSFFHNFGSLTDYSVFQPIGNPVFELTDEQADEFKQIFQRMFIEISSEYVHKYDLLRNLVFEIIHKAVKAQPAEREASKQIDGSNRILLLFLELLERQFPIEDSRQRVQLKSASDFANQLSVHVNHLNKALQKTTQKSTSEIISERLLQEAKILLKHTQWNISEIGYTLGFKEVTHFNNFFKKHSNLNPTQFRND